MATDARTTALSWRTDSSGDLRAWIQIVHDALVAVGLIQTADSGQLVIGSAISPGSPNSSAGYEIWRFNDTLQSTAPVFIKIEYGGGNQAGNSNPAIWITVGTGTNGAGTITGTSIFPRTQMQIIDPTTGILTGPTRPLWTSGAANRIAQLLCRDGTTNIGNAFWAVERTKDAAGVDTNEGIHVVTRSCCPVNSNTIAPTFWAQTLIFSITTGQTQATGPMCIVSNEGTATDAGNTGIFPWQMASKRGNENPPLGWTSYFYGDLNGSVDAVVTMYGSAHTYRTLGAAAGQANTAGIQRAGWRPSSTSTAITAHDSIHFAMRWE